MAAEGGIDGALASEAVAEDPQALDYKVRYVGVRQGVRGAGQEGHL